MFNNTGTIETVTDRAEEYAAVVADAAAAAVGELEELPEVSTRAWREQKLITLAIIGAAIGVLVYRLVGRDSDEESGG